MERINGPNRHHDQSRPFRGPALVLGAALCLATGLVLGAAGATLSEPEPLLSPPTAETTPAMDSSRDLVMRFYAAFNAALINGDASPLVGIVAIDFVDHTQPPDAVPGMAGMTKAVTALRASQPGVQLTVAAMFVDGDRVLVYLAADPGRADVSSGSTSDSWVGRSMAVTPTASDRAGDAIEVLRIADGRVAERWRMTSGNPAAEPGRCVRETGEVCIP